MNNMKLIYLFFFICVLMISCRPDITIIGHWRRADLAKVNGNDRSIKFGDMLLNSDSTFIFAGSDNSGIVEKKGFSDERSIKGKWKFSNNRIYFYIKNDSIPIIDYKVLEIMKQKMVIQNEPATDTLKFILSRI